MRCKCCHCPPVWLVFLAVLCHGYLYWRAFSPVTDCVAIRARSRTCNWATVLRAGTVPRHNERAQVLTGVTCPVCGAANQTIHFHTDNVREDGVCTVCGASNRDRQLANIIIKQANKLAPHQGTLTSIKEVAEASSLDILALECQGKIQTQLGASTQFECKELLQDPTNLEPLYASLSGTKYDIVFSSDVIEHVPDPYAFFERSFFWLKRGGAHIYTVPFLVTQACDLYDDLTLAARRRDGSVSHFQAPMYHGSYLHPRGVLTYTLFGPSMVDRLCRMGYRPQAYRLHDKRLGIIGSNAWVFSAHRPSCNL